MTTSLQELTSRCGHHCGVQTSTDVRMVGHCPCPECHDGPNGTRHDPEGAPLMATTHLNVAFVTETCCHKGCNLTFAFTRDFYNLVRNDSQIWWYCPAGHSQHYTNEATDARKLEQAAARETALRDQLEASIRDAEAARVAHARDRQRIANGVCPCCTRFFDNVHRHMASKHPDYVAPDVKKRVQFECGCGRSFDTYAGLRIHQGRARSSDWATPGQPSWKSHLTTGATA